MLEVGIYRLRPLAMTDVAAVNSIASDPQVARYTLWEAHSSEAVTSEFLSALCGPKFISWAIVVSESQSVIGMIFIHSFNKRHRKAEIAFHVARHRWRQGIASMSAKTVLQFAFDQLALNRVEATCMPANVGSRRVLEKIGMSKEGTLRRSHRRYDGFHDMDLFSILRDDERGR